MFTAPVTLMGPTAPPSTESATAVRASGNRLYRTVGNAGSLAIGASVFSVEGWFKWASLPAVDGNRFSMVAKHSDGAGGPPDDSESFRLSHYRLSGATYLNFGFSDSGASGGSSTERIRWAFTPTVGVWYHIAGTCNMPSGGNPSGLIKCYVDGVDQGSGTVEANGGTVGAMYPGTSGWSQIEIFSDQRGNPAAEYFDGKADEIRIWNDVRTGGEINANMNQELVNPTGEANLVAYWQFDQPSPLNDLSGNGNTLTNVGVVFTNDVAF